MTPNSPSIDTLPSLEPGVTVLRPPERRSTALHRLAVAELARRDGGALWVDARNRASTYVLQRLAPTRRTLRGLRIARAFTAYQHYALVKALVRRATARTALVVAPCVGSLYADSDLREYERRDLLGGTLTTLSELASALDVPVLVSPGPHEEVTERVVDVADTELACRDTPFGYHFESDEAETTVYWDDGHLQTTIPYWVDLFGAVDDSHSLVDELTAATPATVEA